MAKRKRKSIRRALADGDVVDDRKPIKAGTDDGWTEHDGGPCPVADGTLIDVRWRDGQETLGIRNGCAHFWEHTASPQPGDIIAYRLTGDQDGRC